MMSNDAWPHFITVTLIHGPTLVQQLMGDVHPWISNFICWDRHRLSSAAGVATLFDRRCRSLAPAGFLILNCICWDRHSLILSTTLYRLNVKLNMLTVCPHVRPLSALALAPRVADMLCSRNVGDHMWSSLLLNHLDLHLHLVQEFIV